MAAERVWDKIEDDIRHQRSETAKSHGGRIPRDSSASMLQSEVDHAAHAPSSASALHNLKKSAQLYTAIESDEAPDGNVKKGSEAAQVQGLLDRNHFHGKGGMKGVKDGAEAEKEFMADPNVLVVKGGKVVKEREPAN